MKETLSKKETPVIIGAGVIIGIIAVALVYFGNPANMGFCIACFLRDTSGALGFHSAAAVQYIRPEIVGLVLGSCILALVTKEFKPRGGSAPVTRFVIGMFVMIGCLMFLGCPFRMILRLAGGDFNAIFGLIGFIAGALLLGLVMSVFPAIMQPTIEEITGDDSLALGHFGSGCYWLSAQIGKLFGKNENTKTTEDINFPTTLSFLRENTISIALAMFLCYIVVSGAAVFTAPAEAAKIIGENNWIIYSIIQSITFSAGIYIVLSGVRMLINEIVPAFKGISEKLVPNAKPALDCPIVFPYAPNAVLIGFFCSFIGGIVALAILALMGKAGLAVAIVLPGAVLHFFCGATAGVCGNARGGLKGCIAGAFVHGVVATFLIAGMYPVLSSMGFANTTYSDTDFTIVGIIFGNLTKVVSGDMMLGIIVVLFLLPIIYNLLTGKKKANV